MKYLIYVMSLCFCLMAVDARAEYTDQNLFKIAKKTFSLNADGTLVIGMDVVVGEDVKLSSDRYLTIVPVLESADNKHSVTFPSVYLFGRRREISQRRTNSMPKDAHKIVRRKNKTRQTIEYLVRMPYEDWMHGAGLSLATEVHGCAKCRLSQDDMNLMTLHTERYKVSPSLAYVTPQAEAVKNRSEEGKAYLDFPVNQIIIEPEFRNNRNELAKIRATVDLVRNDKNSTITGITIIGHASPEGEYSRNAYLAQGRAEAMKKYILGYYDIESRLIKVSSVAEDWAGLRDYVKSSDMAFRNDILKIIDSDDRNYDNKEMCIRMIDEGKPYELLFRKIYPALRRSDYVVTYVVRDFSVEEVREIIKRRPQLLSLEEMYRLAQTYEKGSDDFNDVFDIAVRMFPEDETANINASSMELQRGNLKQAEKYLAKLGLNNHIVINNMGLLKLMQGNLDEAKLYLEKARDMGSQEAAANLIELEKKRTDNLKFSDE